MENERVETLRAKQECHVQKGTAELHRKKCHISTVERHTGVPQASREPAGRQQWTKGLVGRTGVTDLRPGVERFSGPCEKGK